MSFKKDALTTDHLVGLSIKALFDNTSLQSQATAYDS